MNFFSQGSLVSWFLHVVKQACHISSRRSNCSVCKYYSSVNEPDAISIETEMKVKKQHMLWEHIAKTLVKRSCHLDDSEETSNDSVQCQWWHARGEDIQNLILRLLKIQDQNQQIGCWQTLRLGRASYAGWEIGDWSRLRICSKLFHNKSKISQPSGCQLIYS